ncbi:uncharacterized protein LOC129801392 [Phlebotomus papatasi]|uniref:uncharacterized protein LOC129801392 n=1 Tax=Phlebotomus papatasi TaxID=29031 RepID=UPI0024840099|nr:uncharacterized protein LOC129801392 [Phlebotomus papatasi]
MAIVPKQCLSSVFVRNMVFPYLRVWKSSNIDSIDCFTNELVEKQSSQWKIQVEKRLQEEMKFMKNHQRITVEKARRKLETHLEIDVRNLDECQLRHLCAIAMEQQNSKELSFLLGESTKWRSNLSEETLIHVLEFAAESANRDVMEDLREFCRKIQPEFLLKKQDFVLSEIRILWKEGNIYKALDMIRDVYQKLLPENLPEAHRILRIFAKETVGQKSEGVLVALIKVADDISTRSGDNFALGILWRDCFFSHWFSDQKIALELFRNHSAVREFVRKQVKTIVFRLLLKHRLETVYRLIELLLDPAVDMKPSCKDVFMLLFDYQYWRHNSAGCSEILQSSVNLGIPLDSEYERKLVVLLLKPRTIITSRNKAVPVVKYRF